MIQHQFDQNYIGNGGKPSFMYGDIDGHLLILFGLLQCWNIQYGEYRCKSP